MIKKLYGSIVLLCVCSAAFGQGDKRENHFELGLGIVVSSDYNDALKAAFSSYDVSGGSGWIRMETGYAINLSNNVQLTPKANFLVSLIEIKAFSNLPSSKKANYVFLPGISARYYFDKKAQLFYADLDVALVSPHSDLSQIKFQPGGVAIGGALGLGFGNFQFEAGYLNVPVKMFSGGFQFEEANFGGASITFRRLFR